MKLTEQKKLRHTPIKRKFSLDYPAGVAWQVASFMLAVKVAHGGCKVHPHHHNNVE